jgi:hypothetical protein
MKKILIVEDRPERQEQYIPEGELGVKRLSQLESVTNIAGGVGCTQHLKTLKTSTNALDEFDLLIYHRSALSSSGVINEVNQYCKDTGKPLIHFTGGANNITYLDDKFEYLLLSSRIFYSEKLFQFIDLFQKEEDLPLIRFAYGENWKLYYYLELRDMLWKDGIADLNSIQGDPSYEEILDILDSKEDLTIEKINTEIEKHTLLI